MKIFSFILFLVPWLVANELRADDSISDSRSLLTVLTVLSDIADHGPEMSFFGWKERASSLSQPVCASVSSEDVVQYLTSLFEQMDWATDEQRQVVSKNLSIGMDDLRKILGLGPIIKCETSFSENMSFTRIYQFRNSRTNYVVEFEEGYED